MCGVAGTYDLRPGLPSAEGLVARMTDALAHRGPDDAGMHVDLPVILGNRRLAIFDLSPTGHQPMSTPDERFWITYNGEVYNHVELAADLRMRGHRFRSTSDTEVVLAAYAEWGPDALPRLNGDFAFAIWDSLTRQLFLARDRFGVKGLYWTVADGRFRFASEIKSLLLDPAVPRAANDARVLDFLAHELVDHTDETLFAGIRQLSPGTWVSVTRDGVRPPVTWYRLAPADIGSADPVEAVRERITDAVRLRLRSDVPVGVALSGGLDSSSVLSVASALRASDGMSAPDSFSARCRDVRIDEGPWVAKVLAGTGSRNYEIVPDDTTLLTDLDWLLWHMDEPFHSPTVYGHWRVMERARAERVTVLLEGQGGDEVFAGYHYLYPAMFYSLLRRARARRALSELEWRSRLHGVSRARSLIDLGKLLLPASLRGRRGRPWIAAGARVGERPLPGRTLREHQVFCLTVSPLPSFLHHDDRNSMSVGLEARPPFLDHRLVELGLALAPDELLRNGLTKWAVRDAMRGIVPREIVERPDKQGFSVDHGAWQDGTLGAALERTFRSESVASRPYFEPGALGRLLDEQRAGVDRMHELWRAFTVERWLRLFIDPPRLEAPAPAAILPWSARRAADRVTRPQPLVAAARA